MLKQLVVLAIIAVAMVTCQETTVEEQEDGSVKQGASDLEMTSASQVGEDMFEMSSGDDTETKIKFGFAQIVELDSDGNIIDKDNHRCNFHKDAVTCTTSGEVKGSMPAVDDLGESIDAEYTKITKTCSLSACNTNSEAKLLVSSYIMLNKAYICQPNCEAEDQFQSPVFNGTAKWEVELNNWDFCEAADCDGTDATDMKIFFSIRGSKGGKEMKPKKKSRVPFDQTKGKSADKCKEKFGGDETADTTPEETNDQTPDETPDQNPAPAKRDAGNKPNNADGNKAAGGQGKKGDRKGKGKCRNALSSSFGDEPDDQEEFSLADDSGEEASTVFRMYGMAVIDGTQVLSEGSGFVGPLVEEATFTVGESQQEKTDSYVTIKMSKFDTKVVYDPTVDMDSTGGTHGDPENGTTSHTLFLGCTLMVLAWALLV